MAESVNTGRETLRVAALGVAALILEVGLIIAEKQGAFDRVPDLWVGLFFIVPAVIYLWWLATHEPVRNRLRLIYNRRPKMLLFILITLGVIVGSGLGGLEWWFIRRSSPVGTSQVKIFLSDRRYLETTEIQFKDVNDLEHAIKQLVPTLNPYVIPIPPNQATTPFNVIVRNISKVKIRNASIAVISPSGITPMTNGAKVFSPMEIHWDVPLVAPYNDLGEEHFFTLLVPTPNNSNRVNFLITIYGDNLDKFAATGTVQFEVVQPPR